VKFRKPQGMRAFVLLWFGQLISLTGSAMSFFALTIWAWEITGEATALALVGFFGMIPMIVFAPVAGALVDRWNRKLTMMLSDLGTAVGMTAILVLFLLNRLEIWHLYVIAGFSGVFQTFQWPAYSAATSMIIPKDQYTRASGMIAVADWGSGILAPVLAGALIGTLRLSGIIGIDLMTFLLAILALLIVHIPNPPPIREEDGKGSIWQEIVFGFRYVLKRPSLVSLQMVFFLGNFFGSFAWILSNPMILARTGNDATILGIVQSVAAVGGVAGSLIITAWGGFKQRKVRGVLLGFAFTGIFLTVFGAGTHFIWWSICMVLVSLVIPLINSSNQAIWQSKIPLNLQGRVFSVRRLIAQVVTPLGMLIAGPLADSVFEPMMVNPQSGAGLWLSRVFVPGPGAGMAVIISFTAFMTVLVGLAGFVVPLVYKVEEIIPDFDEEGLKDTSG